MHSKHKRNKSFFACSLFAQLSCVILVLILVSGYLITSTPPHDFNIKHDHIAKPTSLPSPPDIDAKNAQVPLRRDIYRLIQDLFEEGLLNRAALMRKLRTHNIFNIPDDSPLNWTCPPNIEDRLSLPDIVNHSRALKFRQNEKGTWLFYQHLRKAGGTGFCDLAQNNLPGRQTPPYFCMIDNRGSLATPPWNNEEYLMSRMESKEYRITANEWDVYYSYMVCDCIGI